MSRTKFFLLLSLLASCKFGRISQSSLAPEKAAVEKSAVDQKFVIVLQTDSVVRTLLPELRKLLLLPQTQSGEVFFNPGKGNDLTGINGDLPDLKFQDSGYDLALMNSKLWLQSSGDKNHALYLNLSLNPGYQRRSATLAPLPSVLGRTGLLTLLKKRIEEGPSPASFNIALKAFQNMESREAIDSSRPFFFVVEQNYPTGTLFYETCAKIESYVDALQLTKKIRPEASLEIALTCQISTTDLNETSGASGLSLVHLSFPWKRLDSETPAFQETENFFDADKYLPLKNAAKR